MGNRLVVRQVFHKLYTVMVFTICAVFISTFSVQPSLAHSEHGAEPDLTIFLGEREVGDEYVFYFRLGVDHGKKVDEALNGPVHIHSGRPHLIRFVNEGDLDHEVRFGRKPDLEHRMYKINLFGGEGEHSAHGFMGVQLNSGESLVLSIWIPEGKEDEWEMGCFVPGHYEMGQRAPIHVISEAGDDHHEDDDEVDHHN